MKWIFNKTFLTPYVEQFPGRQIDSWTSKTIRFKRFKQLNLEEEGETSLPFSPVCSILTLVR